MKRACLVVAVALVSALAARAEDSARWVVLTDDESRIEGAVLAPATLKVKAVGGDLKFATASVRSLRPLLNRGVGVFDIEDATQHYEGTLDGVDAFEIRVPGGTLRVPPGRIISAVACPAGTDARRESHGLLRDGWTLRGGTTLAGEAPGVKDVTLKVGAGTITTALGDVTKIDWRVAGKGELDAVEAFGKTLQGELSIDTLSVTSAFGTLKVDAADLGAYRKRAKGHGLLQDFSEEGLEGWVCPGGRAKKVRDGALHLDPGPSKVTNVAYFDEELAGEFTIEVRVKDLQNAGVLWHSDGQDGGVGLWFWHGMVSVSSRSTWQNGDGATRANWKRALRNDGTDAVRIEVSGEDARILFNGDLLGTVKTDGLSHGKAGLFSAEKDATFDDFRITPR
ncbi:MAG: DUF1080 domain-containing protein [Planctomycetes bacterium]|nr:DUF1080 domain-containing protein [Planctomycetota bacterium]